MEITSFTHELAAQASELAQQNYYEERQHSPELPERVSFPNIDWLADEGLGVAAVEGGRLLGFMCGWGQWEGAFGTPTRATCSTLCAHAAIAENRGYIYRRLYEAAGELWASKGIAYHCVTFYAHDEQGIGALFGYNFGMRCIDAVRTTDSIEKYTGSASFRELRGEEVQLVRPMRRLLSQHLGSSPCFMRESEEEFVEWIEQAECRDTRLMAAFDGAEPIAFLELSDSGESFITQSECMKSICGAFCMPNHRGSGVMRGLLGFALDTLRGEGMTHLGVDYESMNPTAAAFWQKYFRPYTYSLTRRLDECAFLGR